MRKLVFAIALLLPVAAGADFVGDNTALPATKSNLKPIPATADPNKYFQASDYNALRDAGNSLRSWLYSGKFTGLLRQASVPPIPGAPALTGTLWFDTSTRLRLSYGGTDYQVPTLAPTTAGDLFPWDGSAFVRLGVGANNQVFTVDTSLAHKTKWVSIAGDVIGTIGALVVDKIEGRDVASDAPSDGQCLVWDNAQARWEPGTCSAAGVYLPLAGGTMTGNLVLRDNAAALTSGNAYGVQIKSGMADGASAVGVAFDAPSYGTAGAKLVSFRENGSEYAHVDKDGVWRGTNSFKIGMSNGATGTFEMSDTVFTLAWGGQLVLTTTGLTSTTLTPLSGFDNNYALGEDTNRWTSVFSYRHSFKDAIVSGIGGAPDFDPAYGDSQRIVLVENVTAITFQNGQQGECMRIQFVQDGTGGRTVAGWPASVLLAGGAYTATAAANKRDLLTFCWDATSSKWVEAARSMNL